MNPVPSSSRVSGMPERGSLVRADDPLELDAPGLFGGWEKRSIE